MRGGLFEIGVGILAVVYPEPVTTGAGFMMIGRGIIRIFDSLDGSRR